MYITFQTKDNTIRDCENNEYHASELNGKKILRMKFIEEHDGEVVYKVELEGAIFLIAFSDEIRGF